MPWSEQPDTGQRGGGKGSATSGAATWKTRRTVRLKVFDLSKGMAKLYGGLFVSDEKKGVWHTNVVVFGLEYFYMSTICVCPSGMGWPGQEQLTDCIEMGTTERTPIELEAFLRTQQQIFTPDKYDMFKHNCNHFSNLVLRFLSSRLRVPSYILSLPDRVLQTTLGKLVHPILSAAMEVMKADLRHKADMAELSGEIFFYGGVEPLLDPTESRTRRFLKHVARQVQQERRTHRAREAASPLAPLTDRAASSRSSVSAGSKSFPSSFPSPAAFGLPLASASPLAYRRQSLAARAAPGPRAGVSAVSEGSLFCGEGRLETGVSRASRGAGPEGGAGAETDPAKMDERLGPFCRLGSSDEALSAEISGPSEINESAALSRAGSKPRVWEEGEARDSRTPDGDSPALPSCGSRTERGSSCTGPRASRVQSRSSIHRESYTVTSECEEAGNEPDAFWDAEEAEVSSDDECTVLSARAFTPATTPGETPAAGSCPGRASLDCLGGPHGVSRIAAAHGDTVAGRGEAETPTEWAEAASDGGDGGRRHGVSGEGEASDSNSDSQHSIRSYTFEDYCPLIRAAGDSPRSWRVARGRDEEHGRGREGEARWRMTAGEGARRVVGGSGNRRSSRDDREIESGYEGAPARQPSRPQRRQPAQCEQVRIDFQVTRDIADEGYQSRTPQERSRPRPCQSQRGDHVSSSSYRPAPWRLHARAASGEILVVTPPEKARRDVWSPVQKSSEGHSGDEGPEAEDGVSTRREDRLQSKASEQEYSDAHEMIEFFSDASRDECASSFLLTSSVSDSEGREEGDLFQSWEENEHSAPGDPFEGDREWRAFSVKREPTDESPPFGGLCRRVVSSGKRQEREGDSDEPLLTFVGSGESGRGHGGRNRPGHAWPPHAHVKPSREIAIAQARRDVLGRRKEEANLEADFEVGEGDEQEPERTKHRQLM
ncbi:YALI0F09812p, related [Neospora caninum Liverpool]|uniref:YALI0F09812p, related n=1 Tax=Neospora caninum (strain Liverpool) TaxID=572307 RepID=F0VE66_NEOCL|nr:YALI0F09812p, related [Neospora caninum Liverpool]CBZ52010.1 YALI0F09812p, related [Neospora caninum Liverpool]|eukprot:XP_003882042.1 YALI0F09812p, related [Neospora caninum Liverpool]